MRTLKFKILFSLVFSICLPHMAEAESIPRSQYLESVAAIISNATLYNGETERSGGSGFVISKNGELLTALHVTGNPELYENIVLKIFFPRIQNGKWKFQGPFNAHIKDTYPEYDLALLQLEDISYAASLPPMGLRFANTLLSGDSLKGLGYNILNDPPKAYPPSQVSATFSSPLEQPPFGLVEESSLNSGTSGGPVFERKDMVAAVWHGRFVSYMGIGGGSQSVIGMSLIIPLTTQVKSWLEKNKVTFSEKRPKYELPEIKGSSTIEIDTSQLKRSIPENPKSKLFVAAPFGTEITEAKYENISLSTDSGRVVYTDSPLPEGKIRLTLKKSERSPNFLIETVAFEANFSTVDKFAQEVVWFSSEDKESVLAANLTLEEQSNSIGSTIKDNSLILTREAGDVSASAWYRKILKDNQNTEGAPKVVRGSAVLVIGDKFESVSESEINQALRANEKIQLPTPMINERNRNMRAIMNERRF
ncbi:S1 family peptidase [Pseudomonas putida]|uniref:S1 family peptidase n=1 Tax=Pseudomonas putida TaxID=303 RepID=UPI00138AB26B|nr:serine protease [Pseudomonas putida]